MDSFLTPYNLSNFRPRKVAVHTFLGWSQAGLLRRLCTGTIESHNFFVLRPILVKFHIPTRLIESFLMTYRSRRCAEEKLHFTPVHTLRQLKHDEALFQPLWRVVVSSEVRLEKCMQGWGVGQIWTAYDSRLRKNSASHLF